MLRLNYFGIRGRGEISRLILAAANVKYEDVHFTFEQWPELKPKTVLGQLPFLELPDQKVTLVQSLAIARFLAREHGLAGESNLEAAMMDAVVDTAVDANNEIIPIMFILQGDSKDKALEKLMKETLPHTLQKLEKLQSLYGKSGFMVGSKLSWADLYISDFLESVELFDKNVLEKHKQLNEVKLSVLKNKEVAAYLAKRK